MAISNPTNIANLVFWYGADVGVVVADTDQVETWDNQEGTANKDQADEIADRRPELITSGAPSRKNSIRFVRANIDNMLSVSQADVAAAGTHTVAMAVRLPPASAVEELWLSYRTTSGVGTDGAFGKLADDTLAFIQFDLTDSVVAATGFTLDTWTVIVYTVTAADLVTIRIDGVQRGSGTSTGLTPWINGIRLGTSFDDNANCDFGACIAYDRVLTATEITDLEAYLNAEWLGIGAPALYSSIGMGVGVFPQDG